MRTSYRHYLKIILFLQHPTAQLMFPVIDDYYDDYDYGDLSDFAPVFFERNAFCSQCGRKEDIYDMNGYGLDDNLANLKNLLTYFDKNGEEHPDKVYEENGWPLMNILFCDKCSWIKIGGWERFNKKARHE